MGKEGGPKPGSIMELPVVRYFLACRHIEIDAARREYSLHRIVQKIASLPGDSFPCICDPMALFASLTNGRGMHQLSLELRLFESGEEEIVWQGPLRSVDLGADPTIVHGLPIPLKNVTFAHPGQYIFCLTCDGQVIARAEIEVT